MIPFSVLDLSPILQGGDAGQSLRNTLDLARAAERLSYRRYWIAEHHNMPGIASAATSVVMAHVAAGTDRIRVGAGGIMLPNHAPLVIAEQFGTLAALHPGRIDLGLGRAPGTDPVTSRALRRTLNSDSDQFPQDVIEVLNYFRPGSHPPGNEGGVRAIPGEGLDVPVWILGSSLFGAQLAAHLGLPYAFASHFAPEHLMRAIAIYRELFQPSERLKKPYVMLGLSVFAAATDAEGEYLASSMQQAFVNMRTGNPSPLQPPVKDYLGTLGAQGKMILERTMSVAAIGSPKTVRASLEKFVAATGADELMITSQIFDHAARVRSYEITAALFP